MIKNSFLIKSQKKPGKIRRSSNPKSRGVSTSRKLRRDFAFLPYKRLNRTVVSLNIRDNTTSFKSHLSPRSKTFDHGEYASKIIKQVQMIYPGCFDKKDCDTACVETV